jgi:excisionase family DNA binding protein
MPDDFNPTEWITTTEAAELAGYSSITLRQLAREGRITACKLGRD